MSTESSKEPLIAYDREKAERAPYKRVRFAHAAHERRLAAAKPQGITSSAATKVIVTPTPVPV